jgi:hypothetical protein
MAPLTRAGSAPGPKSRNDDECRLQINNIFGLVYSSALFSMLLYPLALA